MWGVFYFKIEGSVPENAFCQRLNCEKDEGIRKKRYSILITFV